MQMNSQYIIWKNITDIKCKNFDKNKQQTNNRTEIWLKMVEHVPDMPWFPIPHGFLCREGFGPGGPSAAFTYQVCTSDWTLLDDFPKYCWVVTPIDNKIYFQIYGLLKIV